tara:strand:+ start:1148 stop:1804 length:657 start_codon:yes stop_codon:yes gene_type:complete
MIKLNHIKKSFALPQRSIEVLKDISFSLDKGKSLSIIGPSGSGKTTLLSLLSGLEHGDSGEIEIAGVKINNLSENELSHFRAQNIGIIFQNYHLVSYLTAKENVELARDIKDNQEDPLKWLDLVGLKDRANHYPHQLSGGECQRVAIARALIMKPEIIIADEPSGNLDRETGNRVMDMLFALLRQLHSTLVLVTHDEELAARTDFRKKLHNGTLIDVD